MKIKQLQTILGAVVLAFAAAIALAQATPHMANSALGTWEIVSKEYAGQPSPITQREIKILAPGHFMWVIYDKGTMKTVGAGTGTWKLNGDNYTEHVDFADAEGAAGLNGSDFKFTIVVVGDTHTQTGTMGTTQMKEVWKRLK